MKYYKSTKFSKLIASTGFITITACLLIAIGAIGWFVLSNKSNVSQTPDTQPEQSYQDNDNSYNSKVEITDTEPETPITDINDDVNDVPYSEPEITVVPQEESPTFILPVTGNISKGYSDTALQYSATYNDMRLHTGVDILCKKGTNILSVGTGTVKTIVEDATLGKIITIEYDNKITVKYCGMDSINFKENDNVVTGDVIGTSGEIPSECADNPHIHIEVTVDGNVTSPLAALGLE